MLEYCLVWAEQHCNLPGVTDTRAGIYCRISRDRVGAELGVKRQETECRGLAEQRKWPIFGVYADDDISAFSGKKRPDYERLLADLTAGRINLVVAWHPDRLHRSPIELERYIAVCDPRNVPTHTVRAGELDLSTANGRMTARITGAVARHESEQKGERVRSQKRQARNDGKWLGGERPFGFAPDGYTVRPTLEQVTAMFRRAADLYGHEMPDDAELMRLTEQYTAEADAIADATTRALAGVSLRSLFQEWNAAGLTTINGMPWNGSKIRQMLLRPRNAGLLGRTRNGNHFAVQVLGDAKWEAVVDPDTWEAFRAMLTDPGRQTHQGNLSQRLVGSHLYQCGCGERLKSGGNNAVDGGRGRYICPAGHLSRAAGHIDDYVFKAVEKRLLRCGSQLIRPSADVAPLRAKAEALRIRADEIASLVADPEAGMTAAQFKISNERIQSQLRAVKSEIAVATGDDALGGVADAMDPVSAFRGAGIERQRAVIGALMTVTILLGKPSRQPDRTYFDPESVVIAERRQCLD